LKPRSKPEIVKTILSFWSLFTKFGPDCFGGCTGHNSRAAHSPSTLCAFAAHKVAAAGALVPDPAAGGNFNSFAQPFMGFLFRHLANSFKA